MKRPERETDHPSPTSVEVKKEYSYVFPDVHTDSFFFTLAFNVSTPIAKMYGYKRLQ
jgi:hypothetical protein